VLEAWGRPAVPPSRVFRLHREGLEKDLSPVTAKWPGFGATRRREQCLLVGHSQILTSEQGLPKGPGSP
jgi:hypothetical protein